MDTKEKLAELRQKITALSGKADLDETEVTELDALNTEAKKLAVKLEASKQAEAMRLEEDKIRQDETKQAIEEAVKRERERVEAAHNRPASDAPYATQFKDEAKFDDLNDAELSFFIETAKSFRRQGMDVNVSPAAFKALSRRVAKLDADKATTEQAAKTINYIKNTFYRETKTGIEPTVAAVDQAIKAATDPMYTGGSLIGSDWVGTLYSTNIWESIRGDNVVTSRVPSEVVPDGYSSKTWPLESTDMTWYKVAEATASDATLKVPAATVTASQMATANKNITLTKLGARVIYTEEINEDSLIRFAPQLRAQMAKSGADTLESAIIDGDSDLSSSTSINDIAGTPAATDYFLVFDGFRKLPLVTNTANSRSAAGGLTVEDYIDTLKLMGVAGLAGSDPRQVAFIVDFNTHWANMKLPEAKTRDVYSNATFENGFLRRAWGYEVIPAFNMHKPSASAGYERKANSAGKIDLDTAGNNLYGAILAVRFDQWKMPYKRRMSMEVTRIANADSWEIVAFMRLGLGYRDTEASAISYYVGV